ncbi:MAG TPA: hypothetical protein VH917_03255 [Ignavibacteriaceae bacterium]
MKNIFKGRSKIFIVIVCLLAFIVVSGLIGGCSSSVLAPALSVDEEMLVESIKFDLVVGVEEWNPKIYSDKLINSFQRTNLFKEVNYINELKRSPDLIAKVNEGIYGTATIPIFTGLTFGFFPTWVNEEHGNDFTLEWNDKSGKIINVRSVYEGYTFLGWISGLMNLHPDRTGGNSIDHPRYTNRFKYDIIVALK